MAVASKGAQLTPPSIDAFGAVWTVDTGTGQLLVVPAGAGAARQVPLPTGLGREARLVDVEPAPDGVRLALVLRGALGTPSRVLVAPVVRRDPSGDTDVGTYELGQAQPISSLSLFPSLDGWQVRDIDWASPMVLSLLADTATSTYLQHVRIGTLQNDGPESLPGAQQIAVSPVPEDKPVVIVQREVGGASELTEGTRGLRRGVTDPSFGG